MNDSPRLKSTEFLLRLLLPAAAMLAFCTRFLPYTFPGPDEIRACPNTTLLDHAASVVQTGLLLLGAVGLGGFILRKLRAAGGAAYATALGLGAIALMVLLLGSIGLMDYAFLVLLAALPALFAGEICRTLNRLQRRARSLFENGTLALSIIMLAVVLVVLLNVLRAFVPPLDYDVLEYHLGAPAQHLRNGGIHFLRHNVYAAMPSNVEMLYLLALGLKGNLIHGAALAKLINVALGLLAAAAAGTLARKLSGSPLAGVLAAAGFYVIPWTSHLSTRAYVEPGMILFALLSLCAFCDYFSLGEKRSVVLAGVFAGLSAGCKYPAVLFLVAPVFAGFFAAHAARRQWRDAVARPAAFAAAALIVLSPWLIRNLAATGNPTYPLLYNVFDGTNWSPEQDARWTSGHRAGEFGVRSLVGSAGKFLARPELSVFKKKSLQARRLYRRLPVLVGIALWLPVLAGIVLTSPKRKWQWSLVAYVVVCFVLWYVFTHRIARFLAPWAMIAIVPAACTAARAVAWRRRTAYGLALLAIGLWSGHSLQDRSPYAEVFLAVGLFDEHSALEQLTRHSTFNYRAIRAINNLPAGSKVLMIGEARTFYCTADVDAATVFDENPLVEICNSASDARQVRDALAADGITHIYVSLPETKRLRETYEFEFEGRRHPGYWDLTESGRRVFAALIESHCEPAETFGEKPLLRHACALYRVK